MRKFHIEIVTPDGLEFSGEIESLLVRTIDGDVEILAGHADYLSALSIGRARILADGKERFASIAGGFISVTREGVKMAATTFEFAENIDLERAVSAKGRAEDMLSKAKNDSDLRVAKAKLARASIRIDVAGYK